MGGDQPGGPGGGVEGVNGLRSALIDYADTHADPRLHEWRTTSPLRTLIEGRVDALLASAASAESCLSEATALGEAFIEGEQTCIVACDVGPMVVRLSRRADTQWFPFVIIEARTFPLDSSDAADAVWRAVRAQFGAWSPERITVYLHATEEDALSDDLRTSRFELYKHYVTAPLTLMQAKAPPRGVDGLRLYEPSDLTWYDAYAVEYQRFWASVPRLQPYVRVESREDMERYLRTGVLRLIEINGEIAGSLAAERADAPAIDGWCMRERFFYERFRGMGLGAASLWLFLQDLTGDPDDQLWGTIVPQNAPSLRSAQRMGRAVVGGSYWVGASASS